MSLGGDLPMGCLPREGCLPRGGVSSQVGYCLEGVCPGGVYPGGVCLGDLRAATRHLTVVNAAREPGAEGKKFGVEIAEAM